MGEKNGFASNHLLYLLVANTHRPVRKNSPEKWAETVTNLGISWMSSWKLGSWRRVGGLVSAHCDSFPFTESCMTLWHILWQFGNRVLAHKHRPWGAEAGRCCKKANGSITVLEPVLRKCAYTRHSSAGTLTAMAAMGYRLCWLAVWVNKYFI